MTDIFFSYKSDDRERVRPVRDAFAAQGFDVFWDQQVPAGVDWDSWIRQHLTQSKCAIVFWSVASVMSDNVRHEATVAKQQGKLVPAMLEPLTTEQFPMGVSEAEAMRAAAQQQADEERRKRLAVEGLFAREKVKVARSTTETQASDEEAKSHGVSDDSARESTPLWAKDTGANRERPNGGRIGIPVILLGLLLALFGFAVFVSLPVHDSAVGMWLLLFGFVLTMAGTALEYSARRRKP